MFFLLTGWSSGALPAEAGSVMRRARPQGRGGVDGFRDAGMIQGEADRSKENMRPPQGARRVSAANSVSTEGAGGRPPPPLGGPHERSEPDIPGRGAGAEGGGHARAATPPRGASRTHATIGRHAVTIAVSMPASSQISAYV